MGGLARIREIRRRDERYNRLKAAPEPAHVRVEPGAGLLVPLCLREQLALPWLASGDLGSELAFEEVELAGFRLDCGPVILEFSEGLRVRLDELKRATASGKPLLRAVFHLQ